MRPPPLQEKKASLQAQMEKLNSDGSGGLAVVSEEEWRLKYESMKAALPQYKKMKKELGDIEVRGGQGRGRGGREGLGWLEEEVVQGRVVGMEGSETRWVLGGER